MHLKNYWCTHCIKSFDGNVENLGETSILYNTHFTDIKYNDTLPNINTLSISNARKFNKCIENEDKYIICYDFSW